jgi:hypothetical protein
MKIPLRIKPAHNQYLLQAELSADPQQHTAGVPWLCGEIGMPAPHRLNLILRLHNSAGIPVIEGQTIVEAGQRQVTFRELRALGIEAYAHVGDEQRVQVARRIWSRCVYGTLVIQ